MTPYATISEANVYFLYRLNTDSWDDADSTTKLKALGSATILIDRLNFAGEKTDDAQEMQFPRGGDVDVPQDVKDATCELALTLLINGTMPSEDLSNRNVVQQVIGKASTTWDTKFIASNELAGIPSQAAWSILKPYLRDPNELKVERRS